MIRIFLAILFTGTASYFFIDKEGKPNPEKEALIQQAIYMAMTQAHLQPIKIDDEFSEGVYNDFIKALDSRKRFLTQEDLVKISVYKYELDDLLKNSDLTFFDLVTEIIDNKIKAAQDLYKEILDEQFSYSEFEEIETDYDKVEFVEDESQLKERWRKRLKFYTLQELEGRISAQEKMSPDSIRSFEVLEEESRQNIRDAYDRWYTNYDQVRRADRFEQYINSITQQFDPHSQYFSPKGKQDFNMRMGGKLEGIGAQLTKVGELTQVVTIVPGGPVWKDERIDVNDFILKVAQKGEEAIDITGMRLDDVISKIRGPKGTRVVLTIQKKDESQIEVELERDVINLEIARSRAAILSGEGNEKIGYIDLPMFYNSFDGPEGNSCTKDVALQIKKMKEKGIDGLVLDLRDNLGGALVDAIDISGLFIEEGPIVQVKSRDRSPYIHKDNNRNVAYDGPLVILVNNFSASASEIVAGALKDYGRAIVVGSQTFGKGSVQNFIDLDRAIRGNSSLKPLGEVKLTIQKYYRVNGASTQLEGVLPHIILPDTYDLIPTGERENPRALDWSRIKSLNYNQKVLHNNQLTSLQEKSKARVATNESFNLVKEYAVLLHDNKENTSYSLNLDDYLKRVNEMENRADEYEELLDKPLESLNVEVIPMNFESEISPEEKEARTEAWRKGVKEDFYLEETISIIEDIIALKA